MSLLWRLLSIIHWRLPTLLTSDPSTITEVWRQRGVEIGEGTLIYRNVVFGRAGADPIHIGNNCVLTGCTILGHDATTNRYLTQLLNNRSIVQQVTIEDDCFIGYGAIVLMGVTIGKGSIIGAGAIITSDVPPGSVMAGNPARIICSVDQLVERRKRRILDQDDSFSAQ